MFQLGRRLTTVDLLFYERERLPPNRPNSEMPKKCKANVPRCTEYFIYIFIFMIA